MQVSYSNDVRIYNLSAGKSIPEWINDRRRRKLERKDIDIRRRIQLIQDFEMPDVSHTVNVSPDGRYVFATGTYKPYIKCYDLNEVSLKFARGLDADVIKMVVLSDDYSKFVLLEEDRYVEMHAAFGRYFRLRIPKFGRDMAFCREASDLMIVGSSRAHFLLFCNNVLCLSNEIYRLNLEQGQFLEPFVSSSPSLICCDINSDHQLFVCGTTDGHLEAWDHRSRKQVGNLDCAKYCLSDIASVSTQIPQISAVKFKDALHIAVGSSIGTVLLYDIRSSRPLLVKDHFMGLPIKSVEFVPDQELVLSMDSRVLKMWNEETGKPFTAIEPGTGLTSLCRYPDSGLIFIANEAPKILQYYVPGVGKAPKWCSYLETITEELEEAEQPAVYDDYKFVTAKELEELNLDVDVLKRMNMVRAYMHGFFIDAKLYNKSKIAKNQFDFEKFKERKLMERVEAERANPLSLKSIKEKPLPKVNKELALKLQEELNLSTKLSSKKLKKAKDNASILTDERFKNLFSNPDFQVDETSEQYKLTQQAIQKLQDKKSKLSQNSDSEENDLEAEEFPKSSLLLEEAEPADVVDTSEDESGEDESSESESDESEGSESEFTADIPGTSKLYEEGEQLDEDLIERESEKKIRRERKPKGFKLLELDTGEDATLFSKFDDNTKGTSKLQTMGELRAKVETDKVGAVESNTFGAKKMTFVLKSRGAHQASRLAERQAQHMKERKAARRDATQIIRTLKRMPTRGGYRGRRRGH
uniref:Nucleolar protein 10 n=1 Tax=Syphacia muris TaxID=451379 RepID=A0A158R587_9BILA